MRNHATRSGVTMLVLMCGLLNAVAQDATFTLRYLTPETALKAAQKALETCRADGYQVAVAVADRSGTTQVLLRDRFAGLHTVDVSVNKAWTALTFRLDILSLGQASRPDGPAAPVRQFFPRRGHGRRHSDRGRRVSIGRDRRLRCTGRRSR
jgi:hypothetical protein